MAKIVIEIPDDLIRDMKKVEKLLGYNTNELILSAVKRFLDKQKKLVSDIIN